MESTIAIKPFGLKSEGDYNKFDIDAGK